MPTITAPAARSRRTTSLSAVAARVTAAVPWHVGSPAMSTLSLTTTGTPSSGAASPASRRRWAAAASARAACARTLRKALSCGVEALDALQAGLDELGGGDASPARRASACAAREGRVAVRSVVGMARRYGRGRGRSSGVCPTQRRFSRAAGRAPSRTGPPRRGWTRRPSRRRGRRGARRSSARAERCAIGLVGRAAREQRAAPRPRGRSGRPGNAPARRRGAVPAASSTASTASRIEPPAARPRARSPRPRCRRRARGAVRARSSVSALVDVGGREQRARSGQRSAPRRRGGSRSRPGARGGRRRAAPSRASTGDRASARSV